MIDPQHNHNLDPANVLTLECSVCHRGLFLSIEQFIIQKPENFYFDFWTGLEYCQDHKPTQPTPQIISN